MNRVPEHRLPEPDPFSGAPDDWHDSDIQAFVDEAKAKVAPPESSRERLTTDHGARDIPIGDDGVLRTSPRTRPSVRRAPALDPAIEAFVSGDGFPSVDLPELPQRARNTGGNTTMMLMHRANSSSRRARTDSGSSASYSALDLHRLEVMESEPVAPVLPPMVGGSAASMMVARSDGPAPVDGIVPRQLRSVRRLARGTGESPAPLPFNDCDPESASAFGIAPAPAPSPNDTFNPWPQLDPWPTDE